jgi:hypothetical protein
MAAAAERVSRAAPEESPMRILFAALVACLGVAALLMLGPAPAMPPLSVGVAALGAHVPWSVVAVAALCLACPWARVLVDRRRAHRPRVRSAAAARSTHRRPRGVGSGRRPAAAAAARGARRRVLRRPVAAAAGGQRTPRGPQRAGRRHVVCT